MDHPQSDAECNRVRVDIGLVRWPLPHICWRMAHCGHWRDEPCLCGGVYRRPHAACIRWLGRYFRAGFLGLAAVVGTTWVQTLSAPPAAWIGGLSIGLLATAILVVNNLRDRKTDELANKRTLAVRFGATAARWEHTLTISLAYVVVGLGVINELVPVSWLLVILSLPIAIIEIRAIWKKDGASLNPHLGGAARLEMVFGFLLVTGCFL